MADHASEIPKRTVDAKSAREAFDKTGWAYNPYAPKESDEMRIAEISKEFITLFEKALAKRQCFVETGVELETDFEPSPRHSTMYALEGAVEFASSEAENAQAKYQPKDTRGGIYRAYTDGENFEVTTWPKPPLKTIAYVKGLKKALGESTAEFAQTAPNHSISSSAKKMREEVQLNKVRFKGIGEFNESKARFPYGEHLNISLNVVENGVRRNVTSQTYAAILDKALTSVTESDSLLLMSSPLSVERFTTEFTSQYSNGLDYEEQFFGEVTRPARHYCKVTNDDEGKKLGSEVARRVEWSVPDAASDIHRTSLMAMVAAYATAEALVQVSGKMVCTHEDVHAKSQSVAAALDALIPDVKNPSYSPTDMAARFRNKSNVIKMMRRVVEEIVPPEEQKAYFAKIEAFQAAALHQSERQFAVQPPAASR